MQVLNFYSTVFADQMKRGRKTATIRLGDKRHKYRKNQVVLVTVVRFSQIVENPPDLQDRLRGVGGAQN